jgi:hypothetical protein
MYLSILINIDLYVLGRGLWIYVRRHRHTNLNKYLLCTWYTVTRGWNDYQKDIGMPPIPVMNTPEFSGDVTVWFAACPRLYWNHCLFKNRVGYRLTD